MHTYLKQASATTLCSAHDSTCFAVAWFGRGRPAEHRPLGVAGVALLVAMERGAAVGRAGALPPARRGEGGPPGGGRRGGGRGGGVTHVTATCSKEIKYDYTRTCTPTRY